MFKWRDSDNTEFNCVSKSFEKKFKKNEAAEFFCTKKMIKKVMLQEYFFVFIEGIFNQKK